jgi:hypothetical protein
MMRIGVRSCMLAVSLLYAAPAFAGSHDFVIQHGGAGGSSQTAAPYIDQFLRYAEQTLKWPANSAKGEFFVTEAEAAAFIDEKKPGFGILDAPVYLNLQKKYDLLPIASVQGQNQLSGHLSLVVKDPKLKKLGDLKGKTIVSNHLENPRFLSKIVFKGEVDAEKDFKLVPTASPLKGLKALDRGEAEATLLDDEQLAHMKSLPFASQLKVIYTSPILPATPVVAFGKNTTPAERDAFAKMVLGMCNDAKGAEVCKALQITKFTPPDKAAYEDALRRYGK